MQNGFSWRRVSLSAICLSVIGVYGCPQTSLIGVSNTAQPEAIPVVQSKPIDGQMSVASAQPISYEICGDIPDWQRPSFSEHRAELAANPRYGDALEEEPLRGLSDKFWNETLITFTTYGLSARTEPVYLSGVWTGMDAMDACYEGDRAEAINQGLLAEMWLIGHRIADITWTGSEYQVTVASPSNGLQFVQFERVESEETLPIIVVDENGTQQPVISGDW